MNAYKLLAALFIFEVVIGVVLFGFGLFTGSFILAAIGLSVAAAHIAEKIILTKV